jgi:hypothetical protein
MKSIKQHRLGGCSVTITDGTVEMVSDVMICIPNFMKIGSGIQIILRLLPRKSEKL